MHFILFLQGSPNIWDFQRFSLDQIIIAKTFSQAFGKTGCTFACFEQQRTAFCPFDFVSFSMSHWEDWVLQLRIVRSFGWWQHREWWSLQKQALQRLLGVGNVVLWRGNCKLLHRLWNKENRLKCHKSSEMPQSGIYYWGQLRKITCKSSLCGVSLNTSWLSLCARKKQVFSCGGLKLFSAFLNASLF